MIGQPRLDMEDLIGVSVTSGHLLGRRVGEVFAFKGVPYAAPPVGALRWRPPQTVGAWEGSRLALEFGPAPVQDLPLRTSLIYRLGHDEPRELVMSEDCLYLNVWTPVASAAARLPVLVWVHGGGNRVGHGGQDLFDGANFAARGIVVVTVNMRLGALGFLAHPDLIREDPLGAAGNYGVQDVLHALQWVRENIAAFGGDCGRVTVAGNSAGAATVTHLMAAPAARGLFHGAIGQSMAGAFRAEGSMMTLRQAAEAGQSATSSLGATLEQLRDLPATAFLGVNQQTVIVDGRLLVEDTTEAFMNGRQSAVPLLAGWNSAEGSLYATSQGLSSLQIAGYPSDIRAQVAELYPNASTAAWHDDRRRLVGDRRFAYPVWGWVRTHTQTSDAPSWLYEFSQPLPLPEGLPPPPDGGGEYGTFHTAELPYVWDNLDARAWRWTSEDRNLAGLMADIWATFVTHGDPNTGGMPVWDAFDTAAENHLMRLRAGPAIGPTIGPAEARQAFDTFDKLFPGDIAVQS